METTIQLPFRGAMDLDATLSMGQAFGWTVWDGWHVAAIDGVMMRVRAVGSVLEVAGAAPESRLRPLASRYFDADLDLPSLQEILSSDPHVAEAIRAYPGLRMLRQPFWECLAAFILSTVNNIPRIAQIFARLSQRFGDPCRLGEQEAFAFPPPERLADAPESLLIECGTGFRARALKEAAQIVREGALNADQLRVMPYEDQIRRLQALRGVGPKVADCVALYALDAWEACPLDVWMRRAMETWHFDGKTIPERRLREFVRERFGRWAGYAQLYLYHYARQSSKA